MGKLLGLANGNKAYIVGFLMIVIGGLEWAGVDVVANVYRANAVDYILAGLAFMTGRSAMKKLET